ncbi:twin-arginine translocation signal domain-containing protein [Massilia niabensis]|uniref:Twin-arginine translocation signal domain-containing protein n=1 Tax=Massilia niabensis TaxID=544910 RepID=A0ABW0L7M4_9BURK
MIKTMIQQSEGNAMEPKHQEGGTQAGKPGDTPDPSRRNFLRAAPLGALAVVAGGAEAKPELAPVEAAKPEVKRGYHETDHIRRYYQTAAYW